MYEDSEKIVDDIKTTVVDDDKTIVTAVEIANEMNMNPKILRRKLRKLNAKKCLVSFSKKRWIFPLHQKHGIMKMVEAR